jgi:hypothetical protein
MNSRLVLAGMVVAAIAVPPASGLSAASAHPTAATPKCRTQTYSYTRGKKNVLNSVKGPKIRTKSPGMKTLTDNQIVAQYQFVSDAWFVNITTNDPNGFQVSRLLSVSLYPTKGKRFTVKMTPNEKSDQNYKYDLLRDNGQVTVPVSGKDVNGRPTPKLKRVVVKAKENCYKGD